jgi:hypothetical protein
MEMWDNFGGFVSCNSRFAGMQRRQLLTPAVGLGMSCEDAGLATVCVEGNMTPMEESSSSENELAEDILEGADAIAEFLFGSRSNRRKVYYLAERSKLPIFRLGSVLCARKSVLLDFIAGQEERVRPHTNKTNK